MGNDKGYFRLHSGLGGAARARALLSCAASIPLITMLSDAALAQSATPGSTIRLDPIVVEEGRPPSPRLSLPRRQPATANTNLPATVQERFDALPGAAALVSEQEFPRSANLTPSRALAMTPGVVVQDFFGGNDQPRIQIRGSGLQQNPVERGILVLHNGLPINRADGSYIVGFINPRQAESIEVYRGYTANRLGATVLGGALNFVSPTGSTQPGAQITASGGSFGQAGASARAGFRSSNVDGFIEADGVRRDGFRNHNSSERVSVSGNLGIRHSDTANTRFFLGFTDLGFDVAGPLTKAAMQSDPRQVHPGPTIAGGVTRNPGPNVPRDQPRRDASQFLAGFRTTAVFDASIVDVAAGYTYTDDTFRFPISAGIRKTAGGDATASARYAYNPHGAILPLFETTAQFSAGTAERENYLNRSGTAGAKFGEGEFDATTLSLHSGLNIPLWQTITLSPAISFSHATRDFDDTYSLAARPWIQYSGLNPAALQSSGTVPTRSTSYARSYDGWTPSLAVSYRPDATQTYFAAVSRSFEPPTHDDLIATVNGTFNTSPGRPNGMSTGPLFVTPDLKAQTATTIEGGWRGRTDRFSWDAVVYHSWVDNELPSLRDANGAPMGAINADKTTHFGIELGAGVKLTEQWSARVAYTHQNFRFDGDPLRGNNRLVGAPRHLVNAMLQFQPTAQWKFQGSVRWSPESTPVDNMNTLFADPYVVVDLRGEYRINENYSVFGEVTNVFNATYASSTLIVDQARPDQAAFLPGDGRGFFGGVKARF